MQSRRHMVQYLPVSTGGGGFKLFFKLKVKKLRNSNDVQNRTEPKTNSQIVFDATYQKRKNKNIVNSGSEFEKGNLPYSDKQHLR